MRNILIFILLLIVVWWVRRALARPKRPRRPWQAPDDGDGAERMLACDHCAIHIPESEGVRDGAGFFCCEDHRRLGVKR